MEKKRLVRKIALTSNGPLAGKSTLAKHLEKEYGFIRADHSLSLVSSFVSWANHLPHPEQSGLVLPLTVEEVYRNKEYYRPMLQKHGYEVGMNTGLGVRGFMLKTLYSAGCMITQARCPGHKPVVCPDKNVVYDPFRGEEQAEFLRELGFELVQINLTDVARCERARAMGKTCSEVVAAMEAAPELELGIDRPDVTLDGTLPVWVLGRVLMHRPEEAHGVQIFGNRT